MKRLMQLCGGLFVGAALGSSIAQASPCVGAGFDIPVNGAQNVETNQSDLPSARVPGLWQDGTLGSYSYRLFANNEGYIRSQFNDENWRITFQCNASDDSCDQDVIGTPPETAARTAVVLQNCLLGKSEAEPSEEAQETPEANDEPTQTTEDTVTSCGAQQYAGSSEIIILQKLLSDAGSAPGPADGLWGRKTEAALITALGADALELSIPAAIAALDAKLCQ